MIAVDLLQNTNLFCLFVVHGAFSTDVYLYVLNDSKMESVLNAICNNNIIV
jgi:hypothetical protein